MSNKIFEDRLEYSLEKHLPIGFIEHESLLLLKNLIGKKKDLSRKEILIYSYIFGLTSNECNRLLELKGHRKIYVKSREDAIWKYALDNHPDSSKLVDEIFLQIVK